MTRPAATTAVQVGGPATSAELAPRTIAITGGTGFIGQKLAALHVNCGDVVKILSREPIENVQFTGCRIYQADLTDDNCDLASFVEGVDVLYHCAGSVSDTTRMQSLHIDGTRRLLAAANGSVGRWVQLSSVGVYGRRREGTITEEDVERPAGLYEVTKTSADHQVKSAPGVTSIILRPSIVFGAQMPNASLRQMIGLINMGAFLLIGEAGASANYVHVNSVVDALYLCGKSTATSGTVYNLSDWTTVEAFVGTIARELDREPPSLRVPEAIARAVARLGRIPGIPLSQARVDALTNRSIYDSSKITRELGFVTTTTIEHGLREMVSDWRAAHRRRGFGELTRSHIARRQK